ncbi:unnamed protein product [Brachionus calyciflorus]|uniref:Intraflagellar transport protein 46 homolog n=1 Tax=Brachionus calyciflorus TaxID=104777 RepID=A0A813XXT1_9BILA|nr:unnamed protein product [Brachionus calyciflorus]
MADDSDEEQQKRIVENQHYDELLEVADGEEVASIYTPTPRNPRQSFSQQPPQQVDYSRTHLYPQQVNQQRHTPPPSSSSLSPRSNQPQFGRQHIKMSETQSQSQSPVETPKGDQMDKMQQDMGDSGSEGNESDDETQDQYNDLPGAYDPAAFRDLQVSREIKDIFKYIDRYQPQNIELEFKLKPFIPDYIPSIGDIDAFIKIPRPDGKQDNLGLSVVDEPSSNQSDPHVLDLFFRTLSRQTTEAVAPQTTVKSVENSNTKAIDNWIKSISALQKNKPVQTVNYQRAMPNIDALMQVWPAEFEDLLKEVSLPSSELNVDLNTYVDIICALLDIPVYKSRIQSIHVLLSLYSEFKNSEHFRNPGQTMNPFASFKGNDTKGAKGSDRLVLD